MNYIDRVFQLLYSSESIPYLPLVISQVNSGNYAALDDLESGGPPRRRLSSGTR